jgi:hypothetical protein
MVAGRVARRGKSGSHGSVRRQPEVASDAARARAAPSGQHVTTRVLARTERHDVEATRHGDHVQPGKTAREHNVNGF